MYLIWIENFHFFSCILWNLFGAWQRLELGLSENDMVCVVTHIVVSSIERDGGDCFAYGWKVVCSWCGVSWRFLEDHPWLC